MIDETILLNAVTRIRVGNMFDEATMLSPTVLDCPTQGCNHGEGGARWRTQPIAMELRLMVTSHCVNSTVEVVGLFVMVGVVELFMKVGIKINFLSGPGQAPISNNETCETR